MYELLFSSQQPKAEKFRKHYFNVLFPHVRQQLSDKSYVMEVKDLTGRIQALEFTNEEEHQAHQQQILKLNKEINDLIKKTGTYPVVDILTMSCASSKRIAKRPTHITLFDANMDSLKNIRDGLNFVTQTWRRLTEMMIQMPLIDETYLRMK